MKTYPVFVTEIFSLEEVKLTINRKINQYGGSQAFYLHECQKMIFHYLKLLHADQISLETFLKKLRSI